MGVIRSRATIEENEELKSQQCSNEVEQPLLKKLCPFVDTPIGDGDSDDDDDEEESESDSEEEEAGSSTVPANNKHSMDVDEEEEDDSSESESVGNSEGSNSPQALELIGKKEGKVRQDAFNSFFVPNVYSM